MKSLIPAFLITMLSAPVVAEDAACLEREWKALANTEISEAQKKFDKDNDMNKFGAQYSCNVYLTPTEIRDFLSRLKNSIQLDDIDELSILLYFPLAVTNSSAGEGKKYFTIKDKNDLRGYYNQIFSENFKDFVNCLDLKTMGVHPYKGMQGGYGSIWINRFSGSRQLFVPSVSISSVPVKKWMRKNCE